MKQYKPSSGDGSLYFRETTAVNDIDLNKSSAVLGNLADILKCGPVTFPNILAPDSKRVPLGKSTTASIPADDDV